MSWGTVGETPEEKKAEDLLPQVPFVAWIVLGCDVMPPATNICIDFVRHLFLLDMRAEV